MTATIRVRQRGVFTLPVQLREQYGIHEGDAFRVIDLGGNIALIPAFSTIAELAHEIEQARLEAGLETADLLRLLSEQRAAIYKEIYGE